MSPVAKCYTPGFHTGSVHNERRLQMALMLNPELSSRVPDRVGRQLAMLAWATLLGLVVCAA
ncbi:MAG: hypothetical protein KDA75_21265, partial [Planctomycetaceae bacterium]|nr:hypothetical protein [Planctomycetaceae bacterium]